MSYNRSICFCPAGMDACALWRMFIPHLNMQHSRFLFTTGQIPLDNIAESDVTVVQRMMTQNNVEYLRLANAHNLRAVYDLDDNVWNLPATNPGKRAFDANREGLEACAEWANVFTVSTPELKKAMKREWGSLRNVATKKEIPIVVLENYVDLKLFKRSSLPRKRDTVRIGWGGSNTHAGDLVTVWNLLPEILEEFPQVELEFVGMSAPRSIINHPRVRQRHWVHISEYANRLATWDWDIFLAPLDVNKFNKSKSSIKMQEAAALGRPCLATDITNYRLFCEKKMSLTWQLCSYGFEWKSKLKELITNEKLRLELGATMFANAQENFNIEREVWRWEEVIDLALKT